MEKRKDEVKENIRKLNEELSTLNSALAKEITEVSNEERLSRIAKIKQQIDLSNQSDEDINKLLKTIVETRFEPSHVSKSALAYAFALPCTHSVFTIKVHIKSNAINVTSI